MRVPHIDGGECILGLWVVLILIHIGAQLDHAHTQYTSCATVTVTNKHRSAYMVLTAGDFSERQKNETRE
jgi:hypothetical protein